MKKLFRLTILTVVVVLLSPLMATVKPASAAPVTTHLRVILRSGGDDLREGSYATLEIKIQGNPKPFRVENFTNKKEIPGYEQRIFIVAVPGLAPADLDAYVEYIKLIHVSQEGFGQTADNWNLNAVEIDQQDLRRQPALVRVGIFDPNNYTDAFLQRFDGSHRDFLLPILS